MCEWDGKLEMRHSGEKVFLGRKSHGPKFDEFSGNNITLGVHLDCKKWYPQPHNTAQPSRRHAPGLNGRHEPDEGTRMCGGADPKREDGHRAHVANGGDRVRDRDLGEARLVEGVLQSGERGGSGICGLGCHVSALASSTWGTALQRRHASAGGVLAE
jgi:hypothetical protein